MRFLWLLLAVLLGSGSSVFAQLFPAMPGQNLVGGGLGFTYLVNEQGEAEPYLLLTLRPELSFGKLGVGIATDLRINIETRQIRKEDWDSFEDFLAAIRYVRYSQKYSRGLYARYGALDAARLGYGQQVYLYKNELGLDIRKRGLALDYDGGFAGFESLWSNFAQAEVFGGRVFVRPLHRMTMPVIRNLTLGITVSGDLNTNVSYVNETVPGAPFALEEVDSVQVGVKKGALVIAGFDLGLPLLKSSLLTVTPYFEWAKIIDYGAGAATGILAASSLPGIGQIDARLEFRAMGDRYLPSYFNAFYEVDRIRIDTTVVVNGEEVTLYNTKRNQLAAARGQNGWYGSLSGFLFNFVQVEGSYQRLLDAPNSGWLHIGAGLIPNGNTSVFARAAFDRWNIGSETELFRIQDEDAMLSAEVGYKPMPFVWVSMLYQQTFQPIRQDGRVVGYKKQERFEPRVQLMITF